MVECVCIAAILAVYSLMWGLLLPCILVTMFRVLLGLLLFIPAGISEAASLYLDPGVVTINRGDAITVAVRVDTDEAAGECINAADVVLTYDAAIQPVDTSLGDSIFSMWVEPPTIDPANRTITFAGGIPNGYCGRIEGDPRLSNVIAKIIFRSPGLQIGGGSEVDSATIAFAPESKVYLNDGQGTLAALTTFPSNVTLERTPGQEIDDSWREVVASDTIPPQEFSIALESDAVAFDGKYFIVFNTADKETGISHYEVMEEPVSELGRFSWGRADAPWREERSPYVLKDQTLNSIIRVRALDKAGNEYIATLIPEPSLRSLSREKMLTYILGASGAVLLTVLLVMLTLWLRRRRKKRTEDAISNSDHE